LADPDFEIIAHPAERVVTPGAHVTYELHPLKPTSPAFKTLTIFWMAVNDPQTVSWYRPRRFQGPIGVPKWEGAVWDFEGHHTIVCFVKSQGTTTRYTYEQHVASLQNVIATGPRLNAMKRDPEIVLDGVARMVDLIQQVAAVSPPATSDLLNKHHDEVAKLIDYRDRLAALLKETTKIRRLFVEAEHLDTESQRRTPLSVFASKLGNEWVIVDWTNPTVRAMTGTYRGSAATDRDGLKAALADWDTDNRYPDGGITFRIDEAPGSTIQSSFTTDGSSFWDSVSTFFTYVGLAAAVVAGVVTLLAPVPGSQIVSAMIWTSIFSSTAAATINIGQRHEEGFSDWRSNAFDVLSIVGNLFGVAGLLWVRGAALTVQTSKGLIQAVLIGQIATDSLQGVMLSVDIADQIDQVRQDQTLTPKQKVDKILELLRGAIVTGALIYINVKGTKADLKNLNKLHPSVDAPHEKLESLKDPAGKVDLTPPPTSGGHTDNGAHTTKVQLDQEAATPHAGGRPHPTDIRTLQQKLRDAIGNDHFEQHLAEVPGLRISRVELASLTDEEIIAIRSYTSNAQKPQFGGLKDYERINLAFRNDDKAALATLKPLVDTMLSGMAKMPKFSGTVFRVLPDVDPAIVPTQFRQGEKWVEKGFMSTSHTKPTDHAQVTLVFSKTSTGAMVEGISPFPEREVLFPPGATFKVIKVVQAGPIQTLVFLE
jgi:NAD:arginine ADP-ribosyltransferase